MDATKKLVPTVAAYANKQIYDQLLFLFGALHTKLLGLKMATLGHYLFVAAFDAAIAAMNAVIVYLHMAVLFGLANPEDKAGAKGDKAAEAKKKSN
jgi:hypothetical protein